MGTNDPALFATMFGSYIANVTGQYMLTVYSTGTPNFVSGAAMIIFYNGIAAGCDNLTGTSSTSRSI